MPATSKAKSKTTTSVPPSPAARPLKKGDHLFLVDGSGYIFRAYHAIRFEPRTPEGVHVSGEFPLFVPVSFKCLWELGVRQGKLAGERLAARGGPADLEQHLAS